MAKQSPTIDTILHDFAVSLHAYSNGIGKAEDYPKALAEASHKLTRVVNELADLKAQEQLKALHNQVANPSEVATLRGFKANLMHFVRRRTMWNKPYLIIREEDLERTYNNWKEKFK